MINNKMVSLLNSLLDESYNSRILTNLGFVCLILLFIKNKNTMPYIRGRKYQVAFSFVAPQTRKCILKYRIISFNTSQQAIWCGSDFYTLHYLYYNTISS